MHTSTVDPAGTEAGGGDVRRALRDSEARLGSVINSARMVLWALDPNGVFTFSDGRGLERLGLEPGEVVGRSVFDVYAGYPEVVEDNRRALAGEEFATVREIGGSVFDARYSVQRDAGGGVAGVIGVAVDITERRKAEDALRCSHDELERRVAERTAELAAQIVERERVEAELRRREEHFRFLVENGSDVTTILDSRGVSTYQSPSVERIFGYRPEEMVGTSAFERIHPDDHARCREVLGEIVRAPGTVGKVEFRYRHKNGSWIVVEVVGRTLLPDSAEAGVIINGRDVTDRREAERALEEREQHFRRLIETSHDLVQTIDLEGRIEYTGPSVERLLGYTAEEIRGKGTPDFIHPDDRPRVEAEVARALADPGRIIQAEYRVRHKDGRWRWFEALARTLDPDTAERGLVANARDVTDRRMAEEALLQAKMEAEAANRAKSEFLSRMSHELRTPMNSILGFGQLLDRKPLEPDARKSVGHILRAGRHLLKLINEVLDIAGIEADRQVLSIEPVQVGPVITEALALVRPLASQHECRIEEMERGPETFVRADRQRLTQVLLNLLSNGVKYNRPGGTLQVVVREGSDGSERTLRIGVRDTGPGIPPERLPRLFLPFERLGAERSGIEGTGLGLALSKRLVEAMGGTLTVESVPGEGSTFWIELRADTSPLDRLAGRMSIAPPPEPCPESTERVSILYIEDNLANLTLVETILAAHPGVTLMPALQGQLGIELARDHRPDLILLDLHLPDIPGTEVLRRLREDADTGEIPVVVISADATEGRIARLLASGARAYLTKPLEVDTFLRTIRDVLADRRGAQ